jgi:hypothetical protein
MYPKRKLTSLNGVENKATLMKILPNNKGEFQMIAKVY